VVDEGEAILDGPGGDAGSPFLPRFETGGTRGGEGADGPGPGGRHGLVAGYGRGGLPRRQPAGDLFYITVVPRRDHHPR